MGDSTWLNISLAEKDLEKFDKVLINEMWEGTWWDEAEIDDGVIFAQIYEANYGWFTQLENLAEANLTFHGSSGSGGSYGAGIFACHEGNLMEVLADHDSQPVVIVEADGNVSKSQLENVRDYLDISKKAEAEIGN